MNTTTLRTVRMLAFALAAAAGTGTALADKPSFAGEKGGGKGHDKGGHSEKADRGDRGGRADRVERFGDPHRTRVNEYYASEFRRGKCPPGLAKKNNGCMPPGQAKKWETGHPLPRDVRYYEVPSALVIQLGTPAPGYRYVRVDDNILLLATGTRMVVDAIRGIGR